MAQGKVKWYDSGKRYGFIEQEGEAKDLFVHESEIEGEPIKEGDTVEFEVGEGKKGPCAVKVKKVE
jgi:CspA family cold shock protein